MTDELDRLERQAQRTRGQLALDLDELLVRLNPRRLTRDVAEYARGTPTDLGRTMVREMRHDPIPYLLIGIGAAGIAWALASASRTRHQKRLPEFRGADFAPPAAARASAEPVVPARPAAPALRPEREISPVSPAIE